MCKRQRNASAEIAYQATQKLPLVSALINEMESESKPLRNCLSATVKAFSNRN